MNLKQEADSSSDNVCRQVIREINLEIFNRNSILYQHVLSMYITARLNSLTV